MMMIFLYITLYFAVLFARFMEPYLLASPDTKVRLGTLYSEIYYHDVHTAAYFAASMVRRILFVAALDLPTITMSTSFLLGE